MGSDNPTDRNDAVTALGEAARQRGRVYRRSVRRDAEAFRNARVGDDRIMAELGVDAERLERLLAADGVDRCVDCAFDLCDMCTGSWPDDRTGRTVRCQCECRLRVS